VSVGAQGTTTINFGTFPGATEASVAVTGQTGILAGSLAEAFLFPVATADHSVDEQILDRSVIALVCAKVVAGTGFTIFARANATLYGQYNVAWVWN
jgi:hypothetical protein